MPNLWDILMARVVAFWQVVIQPGLEERLLSIVGAGVAGIMTILVARAVAGASRAAVWRATEDDHAALLVGRAVHLAVSLLGLGWVLSILGVDLAALIAAFGFITVGLGLALQDLVKNFLAGIYLLIERPYRVGDSIRVGENEGVVQDIRVRYTQLRGDDGRDIIIPNSLMLTSVVINQGRTHAVPQEPLGSALKRPGGGESTGSGEGSPEHRRA